jgi:perosamine synthetase
VQDFESKLQEFIGVEQLIVTSNGTTALMLAYIALGLQKGDEVIIPAFGFMAAANSALLLGIKVNFVDVDSETFNIDTTQIASIVTAKTKAIVVIHNYGVPVQMQAILQIATELGLWVIEDCAEALGSTLASRHVGTWGDIGTFSFHATKTLTTGEGGAITIRDSAIFEKAKLYRSHGLLSRGTYNHKLAGSNFRLTNIQCAMGVAQFKSLSHFIDRRQVISLIYKSQLTNSQIKFQHIPLDSSVCPWGFPILLSDCNRTKRDQIINFLQLNGIETRPGFESPDRLDYIEVNEMKNTKSLSDKIIVLPLYPDLHEADVMRIASTLNQAINEF